MSDGDDEQCATRLSLCLGHGCPASRHIKQHVRVTRDRKIADTKAIGGSLRTHGKRQEDHWCNNLPKTEQDLELVKVVENVGVSIFCFWIV